MVGAEVVGVGVSDPPPVQAAAIRTSDTTSAAVGRVRAIALILSHDGIERPARPSAHTAPSCGATIVCGS